MKYVNSTSRMFCDHVVMNRNENNIKWIEFPEKSRRKRMPP